jgi:hypothetical protein
MLNIAVGEKDQQPFYNQTASSALSPSNPELGFLHSLLSTLYSLEPPAPPPAKALGAKGGLEEV